MKWLKWLGLNTKPDIDAHPWVGSFIGFLLFFIVIVASLGLLYQFMTTLFWSGDAKNEALRNIGLVLVAVIGAPFLVWRTSIAQKQANDRGTRPNHRSYQ